MLAARCASALKGSAAGDRVTSLPGHGDVDGLYSGYITVDEAAQRRLFYVLVESEREPTKDPLIVWLNGGPGCSSIGGGFLTELGPFYPNEELQLLNNPYRWNRFANVVFVEAPAFVGFSYSRDEGDRAVGDAETARDNLRFLRGFLERFPGLASRPLWLSGESYAGHYVPQLAREVILHNSAAVNSRDRLNLVGMTLGNPWTDAALDNRGTVDHWWTHMLISDDAYEGMIRHCNLSASNPFDPHPHHSHPEGDEQLCDNFCSQARTEIGDIDMYDTLADACSAAPARGQVVALGSQLSRATQGHGVSGMGLRMAATHGTHAGVQRVLARRSARRLRGDSDVASTSVGMHPWARGPDAHSRRALTDSDEAKQDEAKYDACVEDWAHEYLNNAEVQVALHANQSSDWVPWAWTSCNHDGHPLRYREQDLQISMLPVYDEILSAAPDLRILLYSGDADATVPALGTRYWLKQLGLRQESRAEWRAWTSSTAQVGGYVTKYKELTFASVRGAGHMCPYSQPERTYFLVSHFVQDEPLPR